MASTFSVDLISDLHLEETDQFNWEGRATSLFCVIAGGISKNITVIARTLEHLSNYYRGVMYIDGAGDHENLFDHEFRVESIGQICSKIPNVIYLHNHVVVLNGVAFLAANCWYKNGVQVWNANDAYLCDEYRVQDIGYLSRSLKSLQLHHDVKRIVVVTSSPPNDILLYRGAEEPKNKVEPALSLIMDTENKVHTWLYGGSNIIADERTIGRRYVNNPRIDKQPYWPKPVEV